MDFARNERGFCVGFAWNLIFFSFVREREGYKHHADSTVPICQFVFSRLGFWSGNFFLIVHFPDHCLLVPFFYC